MSEIEHINSPEAHIAVLEARVAELESRLAEVESKNNIDVEDVAKRAMPHFVELMKQSIRMQYGNTGAY